MILDTSFLIDLEREARAEVHGPAHVFLEGQGERRLFTTFTASGEFAAGIPPGQKRAWNRFLEKFRVLPWSADISWQYGQTQRYLRSVGLPIGANDLWIAATALVNDMPLVTRDLHHYSRVPGLEVRSYRDD